MGDFFLTDYSLADIDVGVMACDLPATYQLILYTTLILEIGIWNF